MSGSGGVDESFDIFFSYARVDRSAVAPVVEALRKLGLRVFLNTEAVFDGEPVSRQIVEGLGRARMLVAWYSAAYLASRTCQWELTAAIVATGQVDGDAHAIGRRILVLNPETGSNHIQPLALLDTPFLLAQDTGPDELARLVAKRLDGVAGQFGANRTLKRPDWYGGKERPGSARFVGRQRELWTIHSNLLHPDLRLIDGDIGVLVQVQGMAGVGKTLLAEEYALRFGTAYPGGVFWLNAAMGHESWNFQLLNVAEQFGLKTERRTQGQMSVLLRHALMKQKRYLWVVDDLPTDSGTKASMHWRAPTANGVTLVTTRTAALENIGFVLQLDMLPDDEALDLLTGRHTPTSNEEWTAAREIMTRLGNHPLAMDIAGAAVAKLGYSAFCERLRHLDKNIIDLAANLAGELPSGHEPQITVTLLRSFDRLNDDGLRFLHLAALLAPDPIPVTLIEQVFERIEGDARDPALSASDRALRAIKAAMVEGLAKRVPGADGGTDVVSVHLLVRLTIRLQVDESPSGLRDAAVAVLNERMEGAGDIRNHAALIPYLAHARSLAEPLLDRPAADLLQRLGEYNFARGAYGEAESDLRKVTQAASRLRGEEHPKTLTAMNKLAMVLRVRGDIAAARALHEQVLVIRRRALGDEHPGTLTSMNNLAMVLSDQGDTTDAQTLHEHVLAIRRRVLGDEHPDTLTSMSNLAEVLRDQGNAAAARDLQEHALATFHDKLGAEHSETLYVQYHLARTELELSNVDAARHLAETALGGLRRRFPPDYWRTWAAAGILAACQAAAGDAEGLAGMRAAKEQLERRLHVNHREVRWLAARLAEFEKPPQEREPLTIDPLRLVFLLVLSGRLPSAQLTALAQPGAVTDVLDTLRVPGERGMGWLERTVERLAAEHPGAEPDPLWRGWMEKVNGAAVGRLRGALESYAVSGGSSRAQGPAASGDAQA